MKYAGFWRQAAAAVIDQIVIAIPAAFIPEAYFYFSVARGADALVARYHANIMLLALMLGLFASYYVFFNGRYGMTIGRKIMNTKLIRLDRPNGDGIGYARAAGRLFLFAVMSGFVRVSAIADVPMILAVMIDALAGATVMWMLIDPRRRTIEDLFSGTAHVHDPVGKFLDFDPDRLPSAKLRYVGFGVMVSINAIASIFVALQR